MGNSGKGNKRITRDDLIALIKAAKVAANKAGLAAEAAASASEVALTAIEHLAEENGSQHKVPSRISQPLGLKWLGPNGVKHDLN